VVTLCDGGGRAALAAAATLRAGYRDVRAYYLSFADWAKDESCAIIRDCDPVRTFAEKAVTTARRAAALWHFVPLALSGFAHCIFLPFFKTGLPGALRCSSPWSDWKRLSKQAKLI
jgi:hypothetical protein